MRSTTSRPASFDLLGVPSAFRGHNEYRYQFLLRIFRLLFWPSLSFVREEQSRGNVRSRRAHSQRLNNSNKLNDSFKTIDHLRVCPFSTLHCCMAAGSLDERFVSFSFFFYYKGESGRVGDKVKSEPVV